MDIAGAQSGVVVPGGSVFATMRGTYVIQTANVPLIVKTQTPRDSPNCHQKTSLDLAQISHLGNKIRALRRHLILMADARPEQF